MKKHLISKVSRTELQTLFYSPVAWLILIIFTFQVAMGLSDILKEYAKAQALGNQLGNLTFQIFGDQQGLFARVLQYLHLYIPLLTMGLMSRELSTGSIKLLYSSPIRNSQIILGKFLSVALYGLILMAVLALFVLICFFLVEHFDLGLALCGMLGIYLLVCAYAAIGLFMSSLTSYQVVAAIATLALLSVLSFIGNVGQDIDFVRELTYWLSINGRASQFVAGMIRSEDALYFILIAALFITLSVVRLNAVRRKERPGRTLRKYAAALLAALALGYVSSRPAFMAYCDATRTAQNSLTDISRRIVRDLDGPLTMTTYVNVLDNDAMWTVPSRRKSDEAFMSKYIRFKPEIRMKYVYYYAANETSSLCLNNPDLPADEQMLKAAKLYKMDPRRILPYGRIGGLPDLQAEGFRVVRRLERPDGTACWLRMFDDAEKYPGEREISAALTRLAAASTPAAAFLEGHGEREYRSLSSRGYNRLVAEKPYRYSLVNQGFECTTATLAAPLPESVTMLVAADIRTPLDETEMENLRRFIARGGNMLILCEPDRREATAPILDMLGLRMIPGTLVRRSDDAYAADFIVSEATAEAGAMTNFWAGGRRTRITMPGAAGLQLAEDRGFRVATVFTTGGTPCWNETETTDFIDRRPALNPGAGEAEREFATVLALTRTVGERTQSIVVAGDADCLANGEINTYRPRLSASNHNLDMGALHLMSGGKLPVEIVYRQPQDNRLSLSLAGAGWLRVMLMWVLPLLMSLFYLILWLRRNGR